MSALQSYVAGAEASFKYARWTAPINWDDEIVYQIVVDRFQDGNSSLNGINIPSFQASEQSNGVFYSEKDYRHGGDIAGIIQRLDYIADLGVTVLWITPVVKMDGAYHGYGTTDPTQIDPGFGTNDDFKNLVHQAHIRNIKVVMDVVINHLLDPATAYSTPSSNHSDCAQSLWDASWSGAVSDGRNRGTLKFSSNFFGPLQSQYFFSRCGTNSGSDTGGQGPPAVFGDFTKGYFDYDTRNYDFMDVFTEIQKYWIAFADVDGFRLDAAKHVTEDFLAHFSTHIRDYANSLGKSNFFILGEVTADAQWIGRRVGNMFHNMADLNNHGNVPVSLTNKIKTLQPIFSAHPVNKYPGLDSIYDFSLGGTFRNVILGFQLGSTDTSKSPARIGDYFNGDYNTIAYDGVDLKRTWIPLEIHDWPRLLRNELGSDPISTSFAAIAFLTTMQGQPIIYYGAEQGFAGTCNFSNIDGGNTDAYNQLVKVCSDNTYDGNGQAVSRQAFFLSAGWKMRSAVPTIDSFAAIGPAGTPPDPTTYNWKNDKYLDTTHSIYVNTRRMIKIRKSCEALRRGKTYIRTANDYGLLAFSRVSSYEAVMLMNVKRQGNYVIPSYSINVDSNVNNVGDVFVNLLDTRVTATVRLNGNGAKVLDFGSGSLNLNQRDYALFVPSSVVGSYDSFYKGTLCNR
ncbi:hypothetical protein HDU76_013140 [Blyttiomyces sp. JEL0837]|nr:hypothetical protein HDU76_013140 [Blyttiomyces sp. JEL0837]